MEHQLSMVTENWFKILDKASRDKYWGRHNRLQRLLELWLVALKRVSQSALVTGDERIIRVAAEAEWHQKLWPMFKIPLIRDGTFGAETQAEWDFILLAASINANSRAIPVCSSYIRVESMLRRGRSVHEVLKEWKKADVSNERSTFEQPRETDTETRVVGHENPPDYLGNPLKTNNFTIEGEGEAGGTGDTHTGYGALTDAAQGNIQSCSLPSSQYEDTSMEKSPTTKQELRGETGSGFHPIERSPGSETGQVAKERSHLVASLSATVKEAQLPDNDGLSRTRGLSLRQKSGNGDSPSQISPENQAANDREQVGPHKCEQINPSTNKPCNSSFSRVYHLSRHSDTVHRRNEEFRCSYCDEEKTFRRKDALTRHLHTVHRRGNNNRGSDRSRDSADSVSTHKGTKSRSECIDGPKAR